MTDITIMITGVGGGGVGEQIIKSLKMSDRNYTLVGGDMNRNSKGFKLVDYAYILPGATEPFYLETLLRVCKKHEVKALFYGSEPELKVMSENREIFEKEGILLPLNPKKVIEICMDKNKTMDWLTMNGFHVPQSYIVKSSDDLKQIEILPAVLKPSIGGGGSVNTFIAQNKKDLKLFGEYLLELYSEFIVQEYVGTCESEYTAGVICDLEGNYLNSIAVKKNIMSGLSNKIKVKNITGNVSYGDYLAISSGISQGEIGKFPEVTDVCKNIALKLGCTSSLNIQCRVQNGKVYVFEINPRISGTSSLRAMVGYNEPDILIRKHLYYEEVQQDFLFDSGYITRGLEEVFIDNEFMNAIEDACSL